MVVEIDDDGAGIDVARVRAVAAQRGVASPEALAAMPDEEVVDLVFAPGFSTAEGVSGWSGRGVGMDAIRTAVEQLGGRVGVESRPGQGTTVRFTLPFTVMMTQVMVVEAGGQVFGIPLDAVLETLRLPRGEIVIGRRRPRLRAAQPHRAADRPGRGARRSRSGHQPSTTSASWWPPQAVTSEVWKSTDWASGSMSC